MGQQDTEEVGERELYDFCLLSTWGSILSDSVTLARAVKNEGMHEGRKEKIHQQ